MILNYRLKTTNKSLYIILYIGVICAIHFQKLSAQVELPVINDAVAYYLEGRTDECLNKYLEYFRRNENLDLKAKYKLALRLAFLAAWDGQTVNSQTFLAYSESLGEEVDQDSISLADKLLINGISKYNNSNYTDAGEYVLESIQNRTIKNRFEKAIQADSYGFLGRIYKTLKDDATAIRYYEQAIRIDRELNRKNIIANELTELAGSSIRSNPFNPDIDKMLKEALGTYTLNNDFINIAFVNNEYGNMYLNRGNYAVALEYFLTSAQIKENHKDNTNLDVTYNNIGAIYYTLGQEDTSLTYFRKAVDIAIKEGGNNLSNYYYNLGSRFGLMGQLDSSRHYIDLAIKELFPPNITEINQDILASIINPKLPDYLSGKARVLYDTYKSSGNTGFLKEGLETYKTALHQMDTLRFLYSFENKAQAVQNTRMYYFLALKYAVEYFNQTGQKEDLEEIFSLACRSKSLVFDEYLRINESRSFLDINPELIKKDDSLKLLKSNILQRSFQLSDNQPDSIAKYDSMMFEIDEDLAVLSIEIKEKSPGYYRSIHRTPDYSSELIKRKLGEDELIIDFTWHENQIVIMALSKELLTIKSQLTPPGLRDSIADYHQFLEGMNVGMSVDSFKTLSHFLYKTLLKPVEEYIGDKTLFIIPDDSLAYLSFETLINTEPQGSGYDYAEFGFLIKTNPISYYHSVQQFFLSRNSGSLITNGVSAFAPFTKSNIIEDGAELQKLEASEAEVEKIKDLLPTRLFKAAKATEQNFRNNLLKNRIIHVATHGLRTDSTPFQNHLLFYPSKNQQDYKFHLFELLGMQVQSPLVVLSACNTGSGTLQPGEGILSLARAFHFAGTPGLLMSQWPADDLSSKIIMGYFYEGIDQGLSLTKALQRAKLQYLETADITLRDPAYWAGFHLTGYSDPIELKESSENMLLLFIGAGVFIGMLILLALRLYLRRKLQ